LGWRKVGLKQVPSAANGTRTALARFLGVEVVLGGSNNALGVTLNAAASFESASKRGSARPLSIRDMYDLAIPA
jgi:hypothetical protein